MALHRIPSQVSVLGFSRIAKSLLVSSDSRQAWSSILRAQPREYRSDKAAAWPLAHHCPHENRGSSVQPQDRQSRSTAPGDFLFSIFPQCRSKGQVSMFWCFFWPTSFYYYTAKTESLDLPGPRTGPPRKHNLWINEDSGRTDG